MIAVHLHRYNLFPDLELYFRGLPHDYRRPSSLVQISNFVASEKLDAEHSRLLMDVQITRLELFRSEPAENCRLPIDEDCPGFLAPSEMLDAWGDKTYQCTWYPVRDHPLKYKIGPRILSTKGELFAMDVQKLSPASAARMILPTPSLTSREGQPGVTRTRPPNPQYQLSPKKALPEVSYPVEQAPLDCDNIMFTRGYSGVNAYRRSKLAMIAWTFDLAERLAGTGVTVNALHPASLMPTKMVLEAGWQTMSSVEEGLKATLRLVVDPALENVTGEYFDGLSLAKANAQAYDKPMQQRLAALSQKLVLS